MDSKDLTEELDHHRRAVSYDAYDITVRQLMDMATAGVIDIAPEYQRHFVWKEDRESELIESIFLGIPVPSLFMAANKDGTWEVVDGVQRLSTLFHFFGTKDLLALTNRTIPLRLTGLSHLESFNGKTYEDLPKSLQLAFSLRPMRITTLNDKSDLNVRYDLFERLNTGGVLLHAQEIRASVYRGDFNEQIKTLSSNPDFRKILLINKSEQTEAAYEECVLRFFAFLANYQSFDHLVSGFLNDYMMENKTKGLPPTQVALFEKTMKFINSELPHGIIRKTRKQTPINLYEAIAVGTALAIKKGATLKKGALVKMLNDPKLTSLTTSGTNTRAMVKGRIEFVRDKVH